MPTITIRLTEANVSTGLKAGDIIVDAEEFGPVRSARVTRDGFRNARVYFLGGSSEIFGLPQTLAVFRD